MAIRARKTSEEILYALVAAHNATAKENVGSSFHYSVTETPVRNSDMRNPSQSSLQITAANASDEATLVTLANQIRAVLVQHFADDLGHKVADATNAITAAVCTDTATAITLLNDCKTQYEAHRPSTTFHATADATNAIAAADASNEATAITLANEMKGDSNAHITGAPTDVRMVRLIGP